MHIDYEQRIFGLDLVRASAILLVLISHSTILLFPEENSMFITILRFFGTIGVDLFFVLSGFLIGLLIIKQINSNKTAFKHFLHFWIRRWLRTLPNYYLILIINVVLFLLLNKSRPPHISSYFLCIQNFTVAMPDFFTESWSLSIEEFSYVVGPFMIFLLLLTFPRFKKQAFFISTLSMLVLGCFLRFRYHESHAVIDLESWSHGLRKVVIYRIDSIYYGFFGAYVASRFAQFWKSIKWHALILGGLVFVSTHAAIFYFDLQPNNAALFFNQFYLPLLMASLLCVLPIMSLWKSGPKKLDYPVKQLSLLSYALYLVNYSIVLLTLAHILEIAFFNEIQKFGILILYWLLSFGLSYMLYKFFEYPMMRLRDHPRLQKWLNL